MSTRVQNTIQKQLEKFKRKYWLSKLIQGLLIFCGTGIVFFGVVALIEFNAWLQPQQRAILFFTTALIELVLLAIYVLWPAIQLLSKWQLNKQKSAAHIIGANLKEVDDRLLNYLELKEQAHSSELIDAGLYQKEQLLAEIDFSRAISWRNLKPFLLFLIPLVVFVAFLFTDNGWAKLSVGTNRLLNYNVVYERALPFNIEIISPLKTEEATDYNLELTIFGDVVPAEIELQTPRETIVLLRQNGNVFKTTLQNVTQSMPFKFGYDGIFSSDYLLEVIKKPVLGKTVIDVIPPSYTGIAPFQIQNSSALEVPQFSQISISYAFKNIDTLLVNIVEGNSKKQQFVWNQQGLVAFKSAQNSVITAFAKDTKLGEILVSVVVDQRPQISALADSSNGGAQIQIVANDDYGIKSAKFVIKNKAGETQIIALPFDGNILKSGVTLTQAMLADVAVAQVEVTDAVHKSIAVVDLSRFIVPEKTEQDLLNDAGSSIDALKSENDKKSKSKSATPKSDVKKKAEEIKKTVDKLSQKDSVAYQRMEQLSEEIMKIAEQLDKKPLENKQKLLEKKLEENIKALEKEWAILKAIAELKKLDQQLEKGDKEIPKAQMDQLQKSADELEELLKKEQEQDKIEWKKFEEIEKKNEQLGEKNKEEESKKDGDEASKQDKKDQKSGGKKPSKESLKDDMKESSEALQKQLSEMSDLLSGEEMEKNVALLRRLEIRALKTSKNQEANYALASAQEEIDRKVFVSQKEVMASAQAVLDSLVSVTVSDPELAKVLDEYQQKLEEHLVAMRGIDQADVRGYKVAQRYLQYGLNDLAAVLYDILKSENANMKSMKSGDKSCNNPKPGKGKKPGKMSGKQKSLGEKMGEEPGQGKPGKGKPGQQMAPSDILEMIKGQEQTIDQVKDLPGTKAGGNKELLDELNKQLEDLVNQNIDKALARNKSIEDKLIELEESENKKEEQEKKRQSKENTLDYDNIKSAVVNDYLKSKQQAQSIVNLPALRNYFSGKWIKANIQ